MTGGRKQIREVLVEPLLARLSRTWIDEDLATRGLTYPNMRVFWGVELSLIEERRTWFRRRRQIRLAR